MLPDALDELELAYALLEHDVGDEAVRGLGLEHGPDVEERDGG